MKKLISCLVELFAFVHAIIYTRGHKSFVDDTRSVV